MGESFVAEVHVEATSLILQKNPSYCITDILLCFCEIAKPLIYCFALCYKQLNVLKLS